VTLGWLRSRANHLADRLVKPLFHFRRVAEHPPRVTPRIPSAQFRRTDRADHAGQAGNERMALNPSLHVQQIPPEQCPGPRQLPADRTVVSGMRAAEEEDGGHSVENSPLKPKVGRKAASAPIARRGTPPARRGRDTGRDTDRSGPRAVMIHSHLRFRRACHPAASHVAPP